MERQDKYEPIVVNLSKTEDIRPPRNYFVAFIVSLLLLGIVGGFAAFYIRNYHWNEPAQNLNAPEQTPNVRTPVTQEPVTQEPVAQATPPKRPTALPTATPTPLPEPTNTPRPSPKPTSAAVAEKTPEATPTLPQIINGYLTLNSAPPDAEVRLNGKLIGRTPLERYELAPGLYDVMFQLDGQQREETLRIAGGATTTYTHVFEGFGALTIRTTSSSCDISVNGKFVGKSPLTVEGLSAGEYAIVISKEGFHTVEKTVTLAQGERQELFITIRRLGSRPAPAVNPETSPRPVHPSERQE